MNKVVMKILHGRVYIVTSRIRSVERGTCPIAAVCTVLFYCPDVRPKP